MYEQKSNSDATFWVRKSYERTLDESLFENIKPTNSFRDAAKTMNKLPETVYLETELVPLALYQRSQKHFPFKTFKSVDIHISSLRAVKSNYELELMKKSGKIHSMCWKILCLKY